jgi:glycosyltransferase involved in cell wall biosynthesis
VPTGVDTEFFKPSGNVERDPVNLVFTGSMDWLPNEDAIQWFTKEIFPLVKRMIPNATLTVVGRDPYPSLIDLAKIDSSIIVTGRVDDVRPYIERAAAYVVPIRVGGGTRLKIYEAMAMAKPIVSTTVGAEGLPVRDQEELLIADTPEAFANSIISVLREESLGARLGANAAKLVIQNFGWDRVANAFAQICQSALRGDKSFSGSLVIEPTTASVN